MENTELEAAQTESKEAGKAIAIIAYVTIIGLIIAFVMNSEKKNEFASYHIKQSLGVGLTAIALSFVNIIPILGWIISILGFFVIFYMWITGLINATKLMVKPVPIFGDKYSIWFKNI